MVVVNVAKVLAKVSNGPDNNTCEVPYRDVIKMQM